MSSFCKSCGTAVQPGVKFCAGCGAPLEGPGPSRPEVTQQSGQPVNQPVYARQPPPIHPQQPAQQYAQQYAQPSAYQPAYQQPAYAQAGYAPAPKKRGKKGLIILGCIVGFFVLIFVIASIALGNTAKADYYKLGKDRIPSIKLVVGERPVEKVETASSGGVATQTIVYQDVEEPTDDLTEYILYLIDNEGFDASADYDSDVVPGATQLAKESEDGGKIIILDIKYDQSGYTLVITKGKGTITAN